MASITTRKNGSRFIRFTDANGKPQTITLGQVPIRYAESFKVRIEDLVSATLHGHTPRDDTARWVANLDDRIIAKLVRVGLIQPRTHTTLKDWLEKYLAERKGDLKRPSLRKLEQTKAKLLAFFDADIELDKITPQQAADWRQFLKSSKLSDAAIKTHAGNAKTMVAEAVRRKLIEENPFGLLKSGSTPSKYSRYVTPDEIDRIIEACPNAQWRLLFGLARYAGLRIPSESHLLTWADVDFERCRLIVRSPKTEHHDGHDQRMVPITPKLLAVLQDRFDECEDGESHLVTLNLSGAARRKVDRICRRAKVERWERLWQTLRSSCEKQWAQYHPQYAVSRWLGHSIVVSGKHYVNAVPDELFDKAAGINDNESSAHRNAHLKLHERARNEPKHTSDDLVGCAATSGNDNDFQEPSDSFRSLEKGERGDSNPRPTSKYTEKCTEKCTDPKSSAVPGAAHDPQTSAIDLELSQLTEAWPKLPFPLRQGGIAMILATQDIGL